MLLFGVAGVFHGYAYGESIVEAETAPLSAYVIEVIARHTRSYGREVIILWPPNGKPVLVTVSGVVTPGTSPLTGARGYRH